MNLNDIIQAAQGGQGVANLGAQFGLTPEQAQAAVQALMPAFSTALQRITSDPSSLGGIVSHLASGVHQGSFTGADPAAARRTAAPRWARSSARRRSLRRSPPTPRAPAASTRRRSSR